MRKYLPAYLIASTFIIAELHTFWERSTWNVVIGGRKLPVIWAVKYTTDQIINIIIACSLWLLSRNHNRVVRASATTYFGWSILDFGMYLYNYKQYGYSIIYLFLALLFLTAYILRK